MMWIFRFCSCLFLLLFCVQFAHGVTYLKASSLPGGDGSSWDAAFRNVEEAVAAANASDGVVYAAAGVYVVTNSISPVDGVRIYGGFPGLSDAEVVSDRDIDTYKTILTGDTGLDDCWEHVEPLLGEYALSTTELPDEKVIDGGDINFPPAYTGEYDVYWPCLKQSASRRAFSVVSGVGITLDGLWFTGFNNLEGVCVYIDSAAKPSVISSCRFIGNVASIGVVSDNSGKAVVSSCHFRFNRTNSRASGVCVRGATRIVDCLFESLGRRDVNSGGVINLWTGSHTLVERCIFTRCVERSTGIWTETAYGGPGNIVAAEGGSGEFVDCVISNCFSASSGKYGTPLFAIRYGEIRGCSFVNNRYEVKPQEDRCYALIGNGYAANSYTLVDSCEFRGNVIAAPKLSLTSGTYALGILGNGGSSWQWAVVNSTFVSNGVEHAVAANVTPLLSRALVSFADSQTYNTRMSVVNSTFTGPATDGVRDILQYGGGNRMPLNVINSIFMNDDSDFASPFGVAASPDLFVVRDCTVKNALTENSSAVANVDISGLYYDALPLRHVVSAAFPSRSHLAPAAMTPGLSECADIATNKPGEWPAKFRARLRGETDWFALAGSSSVDASAALPIHDACGAAREFGSYTRGAVQSLTQEAACGVTLTIRRDPIFGGVLSAPGNAQAVPTNSPNVPVTAIPTDGCSFDGWYDADGMLVSSAATLALPAISSNLTLYARFGTPETVVSFDLGAAGEFIQTASASISISKNAGDFMPSPPLYFGNTNYVIYGWEPTLPDFVPATNSLYRAKYVTSDVRIIHVVPPEEMPLGGDGSGSDWANPSCDLNAAYQDAALYRGEVWLKEGFYRLAAPLSARANVAIRGGFAGNESFASEADPSIHASVISGDVNGDTFWLPDGISPPAQMRTNIWSDGRFNAPNVDGTSGFWQPCGNGSDDVKKFLKVGSANVTNCVMSGLTLTTIGAYVIDATASGADIKISGCRFLANGSEGASENAVFFINNCALTVEDCEFIGNNRVATLCNASATDCVTFRDSVFRDNFGLQKGACFRVEGYTCLNVEGCEFYRNASKAEAWRNASVLSYATSGSTASIVSNCLFHSNLVTGNSHGTITLDSGSGRLLITDCRFVDNRLVSSSDRTPHSAGIAVQNINKLLVRDTYFGGNSAEISQNLSADRLWSSVCSVNDGRVDFLNCTIENNTVSFEGEGEVACGTFATRSGGLALINCIVCGSELTGDGVGEIVNKSGTLNSTLALVNTVLRNTSPDYMPLSLGAVAPSIASSAISNFSTNDLVASSASYLYDVSSETVPLGRRLFSVSLTPHISISSSSSYTRRGRPIWVSDDMYVYLHDADYNAAKPWRRIANNAWCWPSADGLSLESDLAPDALGIPRAVGRIAYGPLGSAPVATKMILR